MAATASIPSVFINHRSPDVKKTFASHVYRRLLSHGFRVFWDEQELQQVGNLSSQIQHAIITASVHVAIFSPTYAESSWCLEELVLMLESGAPILPVFYHVNPSERRFTHGNGVYAASLNIMQNKRTQEGTPRYDYCTVEKWRNALSSVAHIWGLELSTYNDDHGELLDKVVENVLRMAKQNPLNVTPLNVVEYQAGLVSASSSIAANFNNNQGYDVFINARGSDAGKTFAVFIYRRLLSYGFRVFTDQELQPGTTFSSQIEHAIKTASVHVVILSPGFAESIWCLNELFLMLESGAPILPVFLTVQPSNLRLTGRGWYAQCLHILENKITPEGTMRYDSNTIEKWRNALSSVADISGLDLDAYNGNEWELLDNVVENVLRLAKQTQLNAVQYRAGLASASSSSSSTAANSNNNQWYDVFLNYRSSDVQKTLAVLIYRRLLSHGFRVFMEQELQPGSSSSSQIIHAIRTASVHVAIFSPGYAESTWCLEELVLMLESGAPIIPVYYRVYSFELQFPHVNGVNGVYAQSLRNLDNKITREGTKRFESNTIEKWRNALSSVADISGLDIKYYNGDEAELIDNVVGSVLKLVEPNPLNVAAQYLAGLEEKVQDFESKVFSEHHQSAKYQVVGIVGLGGVGKTTLAKEFFDRKRLHFRVSCFLSNVRENAKKGSLTSLQSQLLKSLTGADVLIDNIDKGKEELKKHLSSYHVLVILDDVDHLNQIEALLPAGTDLLSDSLLVVTSRDKEVIKSSGVENSSIYKLTGLNDHHSRELFCAYAFNQPYPPPRFESMVNNFLQACEGLPLSLKVFGAHLNGENDQSEWKSLLDRLQQFLPSQIQQRFQISYQSLSEQQQHIFLDSACFFIGQKMDTAIRIWDGSGWKGRLEFENLQNKCLIDVDSENNILMHDHLRDFGRDVAKSSLPRRLWQCTAINDTLKQLSVVAVRGIRMVLNESNDDEDAVGGIDMRTLQLVDTENAILLERILRMPMYMPSLI